LKEKLSSSFKYIS